MSLSFYTIPLEFSFLHVNYLTSFKKDLNTAPLSYKYLNSVITEQNILQIQ